MSIFNPNAGGADPAAPGHGPKAKKRQQQIAIAAAGVLLLVIMLARNKTAPAAADTSSQVTPTATPGMDTSGLSGGSGGVDNSAQLASFENDLLNQLPQAVMSGVQAGLANGLPDPNAGAVGTDSSTDPTGLATLGATLTALTAFEAGQAKIYRGTGAGGAQTAKGRPNTSTNAKATPHPAAGVKLPKGTTERIVGDRHIYTAPGGRVVRNVVVPTSRAHKRHG